MRAGDNGLELIGELLERGFAWRVGLHPKPVGDGGVALAREVVDAHPAHGRQRGDGDVEGVHGIYD